MVCGVYQKGTIDVYLHTNILDTAQEWEHKGTVKVNEQNHQSFLLFAETQAGGSTTIASTPSASITAISSIRIVRRSIW